MTEQRNSLNALPDASLVSRVLAGFRRITSSGKFIGEIDGLRFIAIASVVLYHIRYYLLEANHYSYAKPGDSFKSFLEIFGNGWRGVEIFFAISGFVLALPFAMQYLREGRAVSLPQYYLRRVTRLEPPYFLAMILCFLLIWHRRDKIAGYSEYVSSFQASLVYCHNLLWPRGTLPLVNSVAWSLEIEVQFYILAPLIALVYKLGKNPRRCLLVLASVAKFCLPAGWQFPHQSLADYFEFFLLGFLLADLYVNQELEIGAWEWLKLAGAVISFGSIWICPFKYLVLPIGLFFYCAFKSRFIRHLLSNRWVTTIGGMCYSIYLIHWMLITTFGGRILRQFTQSYAVDFAIHAALLALMILFAGALYFKLIERPCMARDWYKRFFTGVKSVFFRSEAVPQGVAGASMTLRPPVSGICQADSYQMDCAEYHFEADTVDQAQWSTLLDLFEDGNLYQTWSYGAISWGAGNLSHLVLRRGGDVVGIAQLRLVRPVWPRCGLAYLRWGPLCHLKGKELDPKTVQQMAAALHAEYVRKRGLFLRIIPNALQGTARAGAFQAAFSAFTAEAFRPGQTHRTLVLDLSPPLEELRRKFDQKWRNQLNRAEKNGLELIEGDGAEEFDVFLQMYEQMVARKKFDTSTNVRQFAEFQRDLPRNQRMRILLCRHQGVPVAGLVGTGMGDSGIYLHGATSDEGLNLKGAYLLQWRMIQWLKENGVRYYNLGGINPETNPGVYHFKKGLSGEDVLYLPPWAACENPLSALFARAADFGQRGLRRVLRNWVADVRGRSKAILRPLSFAPRSSQEDTKPRPGGDSRPGPAGEARSPEMQTNSSKDVGKRV